MKTKTQSLHHQVCNSTISMGIRWIVLSIWRCKYCIRGHPPSASTYRGNPYFEMSFFMTCNQSLHLHTDDRTWLIPISMWPVQFWQCEDWIFSNGNKNPVTTHQICTETIVIGVKWITLSIGRCKDHIRSQPHSVLMCRVSPYVRITLPWPRTRPCTSILMMGLEWYPFQCVWCQFDSARTRSFSLHSHAEIMLKSCMHLQLSLYTLSIYIRKHCTQFLQCKDQKTGWCTKPHTNYSGTCLKVYGRWTPNHRTLGRYPI